MAKTPPYPEEQPYSDRMAAQARMWVPPPSPKRLLVLVSKQVDRRLREPGHGNLRKAVAKAIKEARSQTSFGLVTTNSEVLADKFDFWTSPRLAGDYTAVTLCRYLWSCDYVLAFWAGGPKFVEPLEASLRMQKKLRLYLCNLEAGEAFRIPTTQINPKK